MAERCEVWLLSQAGSLFDHPAFMSTYRYASRRREVTKEERLQALEEAHRLKLNRPHFTNTMFESNVYRRFTVNIPRSFLLKLRLNSKVTLRNSDGMSWQVRCCYDADGRAKFMRGWGPFSLANNVEEGDVCVFELTHGHSAMDVHIFRAVDEITAPFPCEKLLKKSSKKKKGKELAQ
ncbi:B3 domain-containing protein [Nymphaea thermarum]|nr:B3 domain-containing protein [Nymphaea thermarum]